MSGSVSPPPQAQAAPQSGASPQGQPPIGSSPATGPTQNLGNAAKGVQAVSALLHGMAMIIPLVGPASPVGQALAKAMVDIGKHVQPGSGTPQGESEFIRQMAQRQTQMGTQHAAIASQGGGTPSPQPQPAMPAAA